MKRVLVAAAATLLFAGCAQQVGDDSTTDKAVEVEPNIAACNAFATATSRMAAALNESHPNDPWEEVRVEMDQAGLSADGDVKDRIQSLVSAWPSTADMIIYDGRTVMNKDLESIDRACEAAGAPINTYLFQN